MLTQWLCCNVVEIWGRFCNSVAETSRNGETNNFLSNLWIIKLLKKFLFKDSRKFLDMILLDVICGCVPARRSPGKFRCSKISADMSSASLFRFSIKPLQ